MEDDAFEWSFDEVLSGLADFGAEQIGDFIAGEVLTYIAGKLLPGNDSQQEQLENIENQLDNIKKALSALKSQISEDFSTINSELSTLTYFSIVSDAESNCEAVFDIISGNYDEAQSYAKAAKDYVEGKVKSPPSKKDIVILSNDIIDPNDGVIYAMNILNTNLMPQDQFTPGLLVGWPCVFIQYMSSSDSVSLTDAYNYMQSYYLKYVWYQLKGATMIVSAYNTLNNAKKKPSPEAATYLKQFKSNLKKQAKQFIRSTEALVLSQVDFGLTASNVIPRTNCPALPSEAANIFLQADLIEAVIRQEQPGIRGRYFVTPQQFNNKTYPTLQPMPRKYYTDSQGHFVNIEDFTDINSGYFDSWFSMIAPTTASNSSQTVLSSYADSSIQIARFTWAYPKKIHPKAGYPMSILGISGSITPLWYDTANFQTLPNNSSKTGTLYANFTDFGELGTTILCDWGTPNGWKINVPKPKIPNNPQNGDNFVYTVSDEHTFPTSIDSYSPSFEVAVSGATYKHPNNASGCASYVAYTINSELTQTLQFSTDDAGKDVMIHFQGSFKLSNFYTGSKICSNYNPWNRYGKILINQKTIHDDDYILPGIPGDTNYKSFSRHYKLTIPKDGTVVISFQWFINMKGIEDIATSSAPFTCDFQLGLTDLRITWPTVSIVNHLQS